MPTTTASDSEPQEPPVIWCDAPLPPDLKMCPVHRTVGRQDVPCVFCAQAEEGM